MSNNKSVPDVEVMKKIFEESTKQGQRLSLRKLAKAHVKPGEDYRDLYERLKTAALTERIK